MSTQKEIQVYSYTLNIQSVKMKVKFPCKMKLQYAGEVITQEVGQNEGGKFIFNQQVTLKEDTDRTHFEIIANLTTDKGAKYIAGVIKLVQSELVQQEGEMMVINLVKCLDTQACCELRVDQVSSEKVMKKVPIQKAMPLRNRDGFFEYSQRRNVLPSSLQNSKNNFGTKSQFQFPLNNNQPIGENRSKQQGNLSIYDKARSRSPQFFPRLNTGGYMERDLPEFGMVDATNRDKLIEAEVYKQSYHKLKQKYKRQAQIAKLELNRRIALQNNENNYKLEIMRLKLRCEEQEKTVNDRNNKLKEMQIQLAVLQKKELDLNYFREEVASKEHTIRMLEDTIRTLNKDNDDLKNLNRERFESEQEKIKQLRAQLDGTRQKYEQKLTETQRQLKSKIEIISQKDAELRIREERIQREQRLVDELQKTAQAKAIQYERSQQTLQNEWKLKIQQLKHLIQKIQKEKSRIEQELQSTKLEQQKTKSYAIKIEYDKKILLQEADGFKLELSEFKALKDRYQQLQRDHRLLSEDKAYLQKQYEKTLQSKDTNIAELSKQHQQQLQHYKKLYKQVQQKLRNSQNKIIELESSFEQKKNQNEKMRRNNQALIKETNDLKQKEKSLKKSLKTKQQQHAQVSAQLQSSKYKFKNDDQLAKIQIEGLKQQLHKTKKDLDAEALKSTQLTEKVSNLSNELSKSKLQFQHTTDQAQKDGADYKQKISNLENNNREYEKRIEELNNLIANLRNMDKENQTKIQKYELDILKNTEKIEKLQKEVRNHEQKGQQYENQLKNKQNQIANGQSIRESLQKRILQYQEKLTTTKNNLNSVAGEKNKNDKIIELLNREIADFKQETERLNKTIQTKEKQEEDLRAELKKSKQEYLKLEMRNTALKKQYDKFKENLLETLSTTFSQIPLNNTELKVSTASVEPINKKSLPVNSENYQSNAFNAEILGKVTSQNKDLKIAMTKLIEQNKLLQKQVDRIQQQGLNTNAKYDLNEAALNKRIEQLQDEIHRLYNQREAQAIRSKNAIQQLQNELQDRENTNKELLLQIQDHNFTINSLRMDQEANSEHFSLKSNQYKAKIAELQEKVHYLTETLAQIESKCQDFQSKLTEKTAEYEREKEENAKKEKQIKFLSEDKKNNLTVIEDSKKQRKQLLQKISDLELKLSTQIQLKEKGKLLLQDEERKGSELKQFVTNLMKQKQVAIKGDLQKSQQIIQLQANLTEAQRDKEMKDEEIERLKKSLEESKENTKKLNSQLKDLEILGTDEKGKYAKLTEKLKEKERQLKEFQTSYSKLKSEMQTTTNKLNKTISDLQAELEQKMKKKDIEIEQLTVRLAEAEKQWQDAEAKAVTFKTEIVALQQSLFMEKQTREMKTDEIAKLIEEVELFKSQIKDLDEQINALNEEIKEKDQSTYQLSGKIYQLQAKLQAKQTQKNEKINLVIEDWTSKYDTMVEEYQQKVELIEKQKDYFKSRLDEKEEQYKKLANEQRNNELQEIGLKKALEEKVKRLEEQRLSIMSSKNAQIQRLAEDNKAKFEALKAKQADFRKLQHDYEAAKSSLNKFQQGKRQTEEKIKNINKTYQSQLEQLKKRQATARSSAIELERMTWNVQRQVKKTIQSYSKKLVSTQQKEDNEKILSTIKGLEDEVVNTIQHKMSLGSSTTTTV